MIDLISTLESNQPRFLEEFKTLLSFKSISADPEYKPDVLKCADWLKSHLTEIGLEHAELIDTDNNPIVYADWLHAPGKPTIMVYGHYDVQPPDPMELWKTDPFEMTIKDEKIYARGANDNKGQHWIHIKVLETYLKETGSLPVNVKVFLEGDEETGSEGIDKVLEKNKEKLKCDTILVSDTAWHSPDHPSIITSFRGLCYMEFTVTGVGIDLHSGQYGGIAFNACNIAADVISKLRDANGTILIPGFYDDVSEVSEEEREKLRSLSFDEKRVCKEMHAEKIWGEKGYHPLERLGIRPTLDVNGIFGGYTKPGPKTVIPATCTVKVSMRLVAGQDEQKISKLFTHYVKSLVPDGASVDVTHLHGAKPIAFPIDDPFVQAAARAYEKATDKPVTFAREGASIPITAIFKRVLGVNCVLAGFGLASDAIHSPNEHFRLSNFVAGLKIAATIYEEFGRVRF